MSHINFHCLYIRTCNTGVYINKHSHHSNTMACRFVVVWLCLIGTVAVVCDDVPTPEDTDMVVHGECIVVLDAKAPIVHSLHDLQERVVQEQNKHLNLTTRARHVLGLRQFLFITCDLLDISTLRSYPFVTNVGPNMKSLAFDGAFGASPVQKSLTISTASQWSCATQYTPSIWGLDRIDQRDAVGLDYQYIYGIFGGNYGTSGVNAYVVDTGVDYNNPEFGNRASWGYTAPGMAPEDNNGHGTHVAGTVGSNTYGVSKDTNIIAVKVLDWQGSGTSDDLIGGLEWIVQDFIQKGKPNSVVNLSLGFNGISTPTDIAVQEVINAGITVVAAAGNDDADACNISPAHIDDAITVGASDIDDAAASFSNWGECLDIWAPGKDILSIEPSGPSTKSGTSMATPHVTGAIARYLSTMMSEKPTPKEVAHWVDSMATNDKLSGVMASPNKLLYVDCNTGGVTLASYMCIFICAALCYLTM